MDLVTVAVAVYNTKPYLEKCVDSLLKQTYEKIEIVLVNDGSTDGSDQLCNELADKYPEKVRTVHKENGGLSSARNSGINEAKGKYICFVDSDDYVEEHYVEKMYQRMVETDADVVVCGHYREQNNGVNKLMCDKENIVYNHDQAMVEMYVNNNFGAYSWNKLFKIDIIRNNNIMYDLKLRMTQDLYWTTQYMKQCQKIAYVASPLYFYQYNTDSVCRKIKATGVFNRKNLITLEAHRMTEEILKNEHQEVKDAFTCRKVCTYLRLFMNLFYSNTYDKKLMKDVKTNIRSGLKVFLHRKNYNILMKGSSICLSISTHLYWYLFKVVNALFKVDI